MSDISSNGLSPQKDGILLVGAYTTYLAQLITNLTLEKDPSWNMLVSQVLIFGAMIAMREYKKRCSSICDAQTEPSVASGINTAYINNEYTERVIPQTPMEQRAESAMAHISRDERSLQGEEPISPRNHPLSSVAAARPF